MVLRQSRAAAPFVQMCLLDTDIGAYLGPLL
jgi:hypothetical protein